MNFQTFTLRGYLAVLSAAMVLPATTASARDGVRIPPPGEVIREVRGFIHGIGRGIKREAQRAFSDSDREQRERELPRPRRDYGPAEKWDGDFYPDELDQPGARRQEYGRGTPNARRGDYGPDGWTSEEQLRREEAARETARDYRPSDVPPQPVPPTSRKRTEPGPGMEGFRAPTPPPPSSSRTTPAPAPTPNKGGVKESVPAPVPGPSASASKTTPAPPSTEVQYASPVPGKKGLVYPPGVEQKPENMVDVGDFQRGQLVRNPRTGELFRVP